MFKKLRIFRVFEKAYPEVGDANLKGALWTFKQQLAWK